MEKGQVSQEALSCSLRRFSEPLSHNKVLQHLPFLDFDLAFDLDDRMILYNWWIQLNPEEQGAIVETFKRIFIRYTIDSELAPLCNPNNPTIAMATDSKEMHQKNVKTTASWAKLNALKERKHRSHVICS